MRKFFHKQNNDNAPHSKWHDDAKPNPPNNANCHLSKRPNMSAPQLQWRKNNNSKRYYKKSEQEKSISILLPQILTMAIDNKTNRRVKSNNRTLTSAFSALHIRTCLETKQ